MVQMGRQQDRKLKTFQVVSAPSTNFSSQTSMILLLRVVNEMQAAVASFAAVLTSGVAVKICSS